MIKKILAVFFAGVLMALLCTEASCTFVYEYELEGGFDEGARGELQKLYESLPEEIKDELPPLGEGKGFEEFDYDFFSGKLVQGIKKGAEPAFKTLTLLLGAVIVCAVFNIFSNTVANERLRGAFAFCSALCTALCIFNSMETLFDAVEAFLDTLSHTMLIMLPIMEGVYISSGNLTTAKVTSTGISLMIAFTETLFADVIGPGVYVLLFLVIVATVSKNRGIAYMAKLLRGLITGAVITVMTLLSFVLVLQSSGASVADNLASRTLKYAICTYLPLVGGTVAESFSVLSGSLSVIKQLCGITGIAVLTVMITAPIVLIILNRAAIGIAGAVATLFGCEREGLLLEECKGICTMLSALSAGAGVIYIIAVGLFCKIPVAMG